MTLSAQPPIGTPWHEAGFVASFGRFWCGYVSFRGGASRAEFWFWTLWWVLIAFAINIVFLIGAVALFTDPTGFPEAPPDVDQALETFNPVPVWGYLFSILPPVSQIAVGGFALLALVAVLPWLTISVRRLHDAGWSGWWVLLVLVPFGYVAVGVLLALPSRRHGLPLTNLTEQSNRSF